ncbi:uncharacterized protein LOC116253999 [Nymphaea colorata]|uniref:uncharacterized protein LOC116253999 n=1 Tax=Nymphaea colorata TaxID=210225 RepID=UPI00129EBA7F|nr:uncharacterized protein LOC116253999 [Nymphaea colorata]
MKLSTKQIQSPGRTDKYPPTPLLMRRLRLQGGSRRATARSKRTFSLLRRRASNYEATTTQEPSSPKVTCIGQVRVKKKKPSSSSSSTAPSTTTSRRKFSVFCRCFPGKPPGKSKSSSHGTVWRRFMTAIHDPLNKHAEEVEEEDDDEDVRVKERVAAFVPRENDELRARDSKDEETEGGKGEERAAAEPPKNALLLMRCRSAPLRDSSPMSRFWESPVVNSRGEQVMQNGNEELTDGGKEGNEEDEASAALPPPPPPSPPQPAPAADLGRASTDGIVSGGRRRRRDGESEWACEGISGIAKGGEISPVLTRCKSEPRPHTPAGIFPEAYFWKRRVGFS